MAILKSFMNLPLLKNKLNTWLRATKIFLVGTRSIPALILFFISSKMVEISEQQVGQTYIEGKEGTLKYSEKVVLLEGRESTSFLATAEK